MNESIKRAQSIVGTSEGRPEDDFYPTPEYATQTLLDNYKFKHEVWEPACGDGAISNVLINNGHYVFSVDLYDHGYGIAGFDFLQCKFPPYHTIITNPPYKLAEEFIHHSQALGIKQLALLLKVTFLAGQTRKKTIYDIYPPKLVLIFSKRLTMVRSGKPLKNNGMIDYAWFIWERFEPCETKVKWL